MGQELAEDYYDAILADPDSSVNAPLDENPWLPLYVAAYSLVGNSDAVIIDLGCGPGKFAEYVSRYHRGMYYGYDFSEVAIQLAQDLQLKVGGCPGHFHFQQMDLRTLQNDELPRDAIYYCTEVLEHIEDDTGLVAKVPPGATLIFSVPNYDSPGHIRNFTSVGAIWERYGHLLNFHRWELIETGSGGNAIHLLVTTRRGDSWE